MQERFVEHVRLANTIVDHIGSFGIHVEVYRSHADVNWCELIAIDCSTGELWRIESDNLYAAACELARMTGIELE